MRLVVGTRGSPLSLIQTDEVIRLAHRKNPDMEFEKRVIVTTGDRMKFRSIASIGFRGIFEKEIDSALVRREIDLAVHSLKDVPSFHPKDLEIAMVPKRQSVYDVLVSKRHMLLMDLPPGAVVGTGSLRRMIQLKRIRPDLEAKPLRGNIGTRIKKVQEGLIDAVILSEAGINRLGMRSAISQRLSSRDFVPAPGQGALVVLARKKDKMPKKIFQEIDDKESHSQIIAERQVSRRIEGGCRAPMGINARSRGKELILTMCLYSVGWNRSMRVSMTGDVMKPFALGNQVADEVLRSGGLRLIKEWRRVAS